MALETELKELKETKEEVDQELVTSQIKIQTLEIECREVTSTPARNAARL